MFTSDLPPETFNGAYFIDRDGDLFAYVLEYLRTGAVELTDSIKIARRLQMEVDFFTLSNLEKPSSRGCKTYK